MPTTSIMYAAIAIQKIVSWVADTCSALSEPPEIDGHPDRHCAHEDGNTPLESASRAGDCALAAHGGILRQPNAEDRWHREVAALPAAIGSWFEPRHQHARVPQAFGELEVDCDVR